MSTARTRRIEGALARGAAHHRAGRFAEAAAAYVEVLREDPDHLDALTLLGGALHRMERPADALGVLDRAVARDPRHALAQLNRGRALLALGRPGDAVAAFDAALAARPGFRDAAFGRARALHALGLPEDALAALDGHDADPRLVREVLVASGLRRLPADAAGGLALLRRALALAPPEPIART
ncbi:MAG: tetratricopeptide repeat protein, partial [Myxococcota bacterium]